MITTPCFYFSIDTLLYSLANEDLDAIMGTRPYRTTLDWDSIFDGYFACVAALVNAGNQVIADCPIHNLKRQANFERHLNSVSKKLVVSIICPLDELQKREAHRVDRAIGVAKRQFDGIHSYLKYDFSIESDRMPPLEAANKILSCARSLF